jgi:hypothetical protein
VLLRQNCRRHKHGNLKSIHRRFKCRAHSDFGLSEADIAAEQTIHRLLALHITLDLRHRTQLVVRLLIGKRLFKLALPCIIRRECMSLRKLSLRIDFEELVGDILHGFLRLRARARPVCSSHAVQTRYGSFRPDVLLQEPDLIRRHK